MFRWFPVFESLPRSPDTRVVWFFQKAWEVSDVFKRGYYCGNATAVAAQTGTQEFILAYRFSQKIQSIESKI